MKDRQRALLRAHDLSPPRQSRLDENLGDKDKGGARVQRDRITQQQSKRIDNAFEGNKAVHQFFHSLISTEELRLSQITYALNSKHEYFEDPCEFSDTTSCVNYIVS